MWTTPGSTKVSGNILWNVLTLLILDVPQRKKLSFVILLVKHLQRQIKLQRRVKYEQ
jgi:hypothetical protein